MGEDDENNNDSAGETASLLSNSYQSMQDNSSIKFEKSVN